MNAQRFLPVFLLLFGAASAQPAEAQELGVTLQRGGESLALSAGKDRLRASYGRRGRGIEIGVGSRRGVRIDYRNQRHVCVSTRVWVPGHYETRSHDVWVPGHREKVWIEAAYETVIDSCGRRSRRLVRHGYWDVIEHPGHYETRHEKIWVPGRYERRRCCSH